MTSSTNHASPANSAASAAGQNWNQSSYQTHADFVPNLLGADLLENALIPQPHEAILDLACGDGALTPRLAARCANLVGFDASPQFIDVARQRFGDMAAFLLMDAQSMDIEKLVAANNGKLFDAVFSNASIHWMKSNPAAVPRGVNRLLTPGGRFVAECGGHGNIQTIRNALYDTLLEYGVSRSDIEKSDPWIFHSPDSYRQLLESAGFRLELLTLQPKPIPTDAAGLRGWLRTFSECFQALQPESAREALVETAARKVEACHYDRDLQLDYVRLRFIAIKTAAI